MNSLSVQFQNDSPWNLLLIIIIAVILLLIFRRSDQKTMRRHRILLSIRSVIFLLLILMIYQPVIKWSVTKKQKPEVAVFIDRSLSMSAHEKIDINWLKSLVEDIRNQLEAKGFRVTVLPFSSAVEEAIDAGKNLTFDADGTDLSAVLKFCKKQLAEKPVRGGVLISDGVLTSGENPTLMNLALDFPLYSIGIGDSLMVLDPAVEELIMPEFASVGDSITLEARVLPLGQKETISVFLMEGDQIVRKAVLPAYRQALLQTVRFDLIPKRAGIFTYSVRIDTAMDRNPLNNVCKKLLRITDARKRFVIIQGTSNFESRFLADLIQAMPDVEPIALLDDAEQWHKTVINDPFQMHWNAVAMLNFPTNRTTSRHLDMVVSKINRDKAAVYIHCLPETNIPKLNSLFAQPLIAKYRFDRKGISAVSAQLSKDQLHHPVVLRLRKRLSYSNDWAALPPIGMSFSELQIAGHLTPLVITADSDRLPIVSIGESARNRQILVSGVDVWRWKMLTANSENSYIYPELFSGLVSWLVDTLSSSHLQFSLNKAIFLRGETAEISGTVTDVQGKVVPQASVTGILSDSRNNTSAILIQWDGSNFTGRIPLRSKGDYQIKISAAIGDIKLGEIQEDFVVMENSVELLTIRQNTEVLRWIARATGGHYYTPDNYADIVDQIEFYVNTREYHHDIKFWRWEGLIVVLMILLVAEWLIRRLSGFQ